VAVLGYAYLENSDDTRNAPSIALVNRLEELGATVRVHDPFLDAYRGDLAERVRGCDAVVMMVRHDAYLELDLALLRQWMAPAGETGQGTQPVLVDGRHLFDPRIVKAAGFVFRGIGIG
jgi:UDP-N-acetyl-D-mannosaminuronic acid dehydrogenase